MATDMWLGKAVLGLAQLFHPLGLADTSTAEDGLDMSVFSMAIPSYDEVLEARASRVAMVRDFIATLTPEKLTVRRPTPHAPQHPETVLSCLHTILEEEWEHHAVVTGTIWPLVLIDAAMQLPFFFTTQTSSRDVVTLIVTTVIELFIGASAAAYGIWLLHRHGRGDASPVRTESSPQRRDGTRLSTSRHPR